MKALLFDFDGVVIRSMEDHYMGWHLALKEYGIEMSPEELYVLEGSGVEELASQFTRKYNIPHDEAPNLIRKKIRYYDEIKKPECYPFLVEILEWAAEKGIKIGLVTGGDRDRVAQTLSEFGMENRFQAVITADDVMFTKPAPEPYLRAAQLLGIDPQDCIVIENAPLGIRSAKAAGMRCIAVTTTLGHMFLKQADVVADNLSEVLDALKRMY